MKLACLDLEGVLVPEIWISVAERTGIEALRRTTRDEPDYDVLMRFRLEVLREKGLGLPDIQSVIADMRPLEGAPEFLDWLRERFQVVILSDTFYQFAAPLMAQLGHPTLFCHALEIDTRGRIVDYRIRIADQKRRAVEAFHALAFVCVVFVAVRFFRLFPKAQPAHIGPAKPPPAPLIHAGLYAAWLGVTAVVVLILAGGLF